MLPCSRSTHFFLIIWFKQIEVCHHLQRRRHFWFSGQMICQMKGYQGQRGEERLLPPLYDPLFQYHRPEKIQFSPSWTTIFSVFSYLHSYHWAKIWTRSLLHSWGRNPAWPTLPSRPTAAPHTAEAEIKPLPQRFAQPQLFRDFALKVTSNLADVGIFAAAYPSHFSTETHDGEAGGLTLRVIWAPLA